MGDFIHWCLFSAVPYYHSRFRPPPSTISIPFQMLPGVTRYGRRQVESSDDFPAQVIIGAVCVCHQQEARGSSGHRSSYRGVCMRKQSRIMIISDVECYAEHLLIALLLVLFTAT